MPSERITDSQDERLIKQAEAENESEAGVEQGPVVSPATAESMLRGPVAGAQRQKLVQSVAQNFGNKSVQRMLGSLRRSASAGLEGGPLENDITQRIQSERGNGQPLDGNIRREVEASLGHDLSPVRVHTGENAAELNRQLGAKAFTTGRDIFFGEGASPADRELLAHEATHTIQQGMSEEPPAMVGAADTPHEQAAEHNAANGGMGAGGVQRETQPNGPDEDENAVAMSRDPQALQRDGDEEDTIGHPPPETQDVKVGEGKPEEQEV